MNVRFLLVLGVCSSLFAACTTESVTLDSPEEAPEVRIFSAEEVSAIRSASEIDALALAIPGVISIGVAGDAANAYLQVLCTDTTAILHADSLLGTSFEGIPIRYATTGGIEALQDSL